MELTNGNILKKRAGKFLSKAFIYLILIELSFIFLLPLIIIVTRSPKSMADLLNPIIYWLPTSVEWSNYATALNILDIGKTLPNGLFITVLATVFQTFMCAVAGYALGRYKFPGRNVVFVLVLLCIIVPAQTIIISRYMLFSSINWLNTFFPLVMPELYGHGLRGALFVLIFRF